MLVMWMKTAFLFSNPSRAGDGSGEAVKEVRALGRFVFSLYRTTRCVKRHQL
jgi:hypothetical protein